MSGHRVLCQLCGLAMPEHHAAAGMGETECERDRTGLDWRTLPVPLQCSRQCGRKPTPSLRMPTEARPELQDHIPLLEGLQQGYSYISVVTASKDSQGGCD